MGPFGGKSEGLEHRGENSRVSLLPSNSYNRGAWPRVPILSSAEDFPGHLHIQHVPQKWVLPLICAVSAILKNILPQPPKPLPLPMSSFSLPGILIEFLTLSISLSLIPGYSSSISLQNQLLIRTTGPFSIQ